ncbi:ABC-type multidrug transport system, ATPase and permease components [Leptolinea tardivitalis]|nr:ABC transporter ATP-binding protein [Leptolinea tardivitalis]GAP21989.1 ABC-type multidrug transport system, ATPase and permease components [Leptolinea tardivitalis]
MPEEKQEVSRSQNIGPRGPGGGPMRAFEKPKNAGKTIRRLLGYLQDRILALILVVVLMFIGSAGMLAGSYFIKPIINDYILPGDMPGLVHALMVLGGIYLISIAAMYFQNRIMMQIAQRTVNTLRRELFTKMQGLPLRYFDTKSHGELMSRFTNDIDNIQTTLEQSLIQLISSMVGFIGSVVMMIILSPTLFLVTFVLIAVIVYITQNLAKRSSKNFAAQQKNLGYLNGYIEEMVDGLKVVKVFTYEKEAIAEFRKRNEEYRKAATDANFYAGIVMPIVGNLNNIAYAAVALFGGILTVMGRFDVGSLAAFLQYSRQVGMPIQMMTNQLNTILSGLAGAERVFDVMDQQPELDEGKITLVGMVKKEDGTLVPTTNGAHPTHWSWKMPSSNGHPEYVELKGDVRFHNVDFSYEPDKPVLKDISLFAKPGQKIAFVGSTGAGKTTITNLVNRFYDVDEGQITYDGIDVKQIRKDDLRISLGMVLQDTHLFSGTVMENIRYGRLDATDEECIQAAKLTSAHSFIKHLPEGYNTYLTGDGANLSQGQRQLLAIARAAVADPPVMILDEATSSIDTRTERLIEKGMDALMKDRTVFVIAHRLSTVRNSNAIIVLENGEIIERGDHDSLLEEKGRYYQLYTGQYQLS